MISFQYLREAKWSNFIENKVNLIDFTVLFSTTVPDDIVEFIIANKWMILAQMNPFFFRLVRETSTSSIFICKGPFKHRHYRSKQNTFVDSITTTTQKSLRVFVWTHFSSLIKWIVEKKSWIIKMNLNLLNLTAELNC